MGSPAADEQVLVLLAQLELLALLALLELLEVLLGEGPRSLYASIPPLGSQKLLASKPIDG